MPCINLNLDVDVNSCLSGLWASLPPLVRPKSGIQKLEKEMRRLRVKRGDIKNQIDQAEREGKIPTNEVSKWLLEVEILEGKVCGIEHDFLSMSCFSCNCFNQTDGTSRESSNYCSIIRRVEKELGEANELMSRAGALDPVATVRPPEPTVMLPISHRPLPVGIEWYVEDIVSYIDGGEGNIIGIYGMGGVGKTTILKSIRQHYLLKHSIFEPVVIWVVASKDCQLERLQMDIADSLGLKTQLESADKRTRGDKLFNYLKNRNCLLFLDDIWEHVDLELLGMAHSATEQGLRQHQQPHKVMVFTTRSETMCAQMKAEKKIKVRCLNSDQAWQLFEENSNGDVLGSDAGIKNLARELVEECGGLPLALVTVARVMSGKRSWDDWNDALHQIRDEHEWTNIDSAEAMYKAFKLSYDSLENDSIRECLLCCALWPEKYEISKFDELIPCWIGCGIIREFNAINEAFTKGRSHLKALMAASLLEHSRWHDDYEAQHIKMHDVIRDMALFTLKGSGRKWIVKAGIDSRHWPTQEEWQEAERASFMNIVIKSLQDYGASTFPKLSMLILHANDLLRIPPTLFTNMPLLTYLNLSNSQGIEDLPKEIGSLTELQYLNLSGTSITRLPAEFGCLNKLEYLLLRDTKLETVPNGTISNLSMLKWLDIRGKFHVCDLWLNELECFKGRHRITLGIAINATTADFERLKMLPNVSVCILTVGESPSLGPTNHYLGTPHWCSGVSDNLEFLTIRDVTVDKLNCRSIFRCLKILHLSKLILLENILLNRVGFYKLRDLYIYKCPKLKDVSAVLQLPCLNVLMISNCLEMEELISNVGSSNPSFGIKRLTLSSMGNLHLIAHQPLNFLCLEYMQVYRCPKFKKISFGTELLESKLKEIQGEQTWWDNLEWDDESNKNSFTPCFKLLTELEEPRGTLNRQLWWWW